MANKKGTFKSKGADILRKPASMGEFLNDSLEPDAQMHNPTNAHLRETTVRPPDEFERFHVHIRTDLADKIHDEIRKRKRQRNGNKATIRAVIEDALERYFSS